MKDLKFIPHPSSLIPQKLVSRVGLEPTIPRLKGECFSRLATDRCDLRLKEENKSQIGNRKSQINLADRAGLEPATSDLTERHSNRLSYLSKNFLQIIQNPKLDLVGKRGRKNRFVGQKTSVFVANKRNELFQHSFVLAKFSSAFVLGRIFV